MARRFTKKVADVVVVPLAPSAPFDWHRMSALGG